VRRARAALGILAALVLLGSAAAHSLLGWPQLRASLAGLGAPADLVTGLAIGWHFGGAAMVAFGLIALWAFGGRLRGRAVPAAPVVVVGAVYLLYGLGALAATRNPFFMIFVVPALMLLAAAGGRAPASR
jgi:hypothetical protein